MALWLHRWRDLHPHDGDELPIQRRQPLGGNPFAGATAVLRSPFLLGIAGFVVLLATVTTFLYFEQARFVAELFQSQERRDVHELIPASLPEPIQYRSHRDFVRQVLRDEVMFSSVGTEYVTSPDQESAETRAYRAQMNADGSPTDTVAAGYVWMPGSEVVAMASATSNPRQNGRDRR